MADLPPPGAAVPAATSTMLAATATRAVDTFLTSFPLTSMTRSGTGASYHPSGPVAGAPALTIRWDAGIFARCQAASPPRVDEGARAEREHPLLRRQEAHP